VLKAGIFYLSLLLYEKSLTGINEKGIRKSQ
jgi:hypothetical protein